MTAPAATADSAERALRAERAVRIRSVRRLWAVPGTRLGVVGWPPTPSQRLFWRWHYWWQAHLLDCLIDAQLRAPDDARLAEIRRLIRGHRLRNAGRWGNSYYDDIAWWALALQRAGSLDAGTGRQLAAPILELTRSITDAWSDDAGGGIPWRRSDVFRNTAANGPAAILLARTGNVARAIATADWIDTRLRIADSDLIADGLRPGEGQGEIAIEETVYTYCQGVVLGAELELVLRTDRDASRIHRLVAAVGSQLASDTVLTGHGGGNGGLFTGILVRYLALVATLLPRHTEQDRDTREQAAALVIGSADAAWRHAAAVGDLPIFGADWSSPAAVPGRGGIGQIRGNAMVESSRDPERDLSVQLSGWMVMEAAHRVTLQIGSNSNGLDGP